MSTYPADPRWDRSIRVPIGWTLEAYTLPAEALPPIRVTAAQAEAWLAAGAIDDDVDVPAPPVRCYLVGASLRDPDGRVRMVGMLPAPVILEPEGSG